MTGGPERAPRRLVSIRRRVQPNRLVRYDGLWSRVRDAAVSHGAHAWRFRGADAASLYLEFLEFAADRDPRGDPELRALLAQLEAEFGTPQEEEWNEL